jgi:hypothetical protein
MNLPSHGARIGATRVAPAVRTIAFAQMRTMPKLMMDIFIPLTWAQIKPRRAEWSNTLPVHQTALTPVI